MKILSHRRNFLSSMLVLTLLTSGLTWIAGLATASSEKPIKTILSEQPVELKDKNFNLLVRTMEWPVGYKSNPHTHKGPGPRFVISGKVRIDDQGKIGDYSEGEYFWHPGGFPHTAQNISDKPTKVLIIEMLPK